MTPDDEVKRKKLTLWQKNFMLKAEMGQKIKRIPSLIVLAWHNITIEPVVFLYLTSVGLIYVIRPNLLLGL